MVKIKKANRVGMVSCVGNVGEGLPSIAESCDQCLRIADDDHGECVVIGLGSRARSPMRVHRGPTGVDPRDLTWFAPGGGYHE